MSDFFSVFQSFSTSSRVLIAIVRNDYFIHDHDLWIISNFRLFQEDDEAASNCKKYLFNCYVEKNVTKAQTSLEPWMRLISNIQYQIWQALPDPLDRFLFPVQAPIAKLIITSGKFKVLYLKFIPNNRFLWKPYLLQKYE